MSDASERNKNVPSTPHPLSPYRSSSPFHLRPSRIPGVKFIAHDEIYIAMELERRSLVYSANGPWRVTELEGRRGKRYPDFLVLHEGRWGILEVDGSSHVGKNAEDRARDEVLRRNGFSIVRHYDSALCRIAAEDVVDDFMEELRRGRGSG